MELSNTRTTKVQLAVEVEGTQDVIHTFVERFSTTEGRTLYCIVLRKIFLGSARDRNRVYLP